VLIAPRPDPVDDVMANFGMCSPWISVNVLMLDHKRVVVEASQPTLHRALKDWGFLVGSDFLLLLDDGDGQALIPPRQLQRRCLRR
jgi:hypothetical protein